MSQKIETLAVLQARVSSSRLRGKVLEPVSGTPMILQQISRIKASNEIDHLVVATSEEKSDDVLANLMSSNGIDCFRGSLNDVLSRFVSCIDEFPAQNIIRLTADCPLVDPKLVDLIVLAHKFCGSDYTSNTLERTFPRGLDVECFSAEALYRLQSYKLSDEEREHVTMGIYNRPSEFRLQNIASLDDRSELRWTVDYPDDLTFVQKVYESLFFENRLFTTNDIYKLIDDRPEFSRCESDVVQNQS
jgi:spore coat polysaccharide biosynthesis protein SpsF